MPRWLYLNVLPAKRLHHALKPVPLLLLLLALKLLFLSLIENVSGFFSVLLLSPSSARLRSSGCAEASRAMIVLYVCGDRLNQ
jgi:hypothetical protein